LIPYIHELFQHDLIDDAKIRNSNIETRIAQKAMTEAEKQPYPSDKENSGVFGSLF